MHQVEPSRLEFLVDYLLEPLALGVVAGHEEHAHAIAALLGHRNTVEQYVFVRNLNHYAGAVAGHTVSAFGASVGQVFEDCQTAVHYRVVLAAVNLDDHRHTAAVMFIHR